MFIQRGQTPLGSLGVGAHTGTGSCCGLVRGDGIADLEEEALNFRSDAGKVAIPEAIAIILRGRRQQRVDKEPKREATLMSSMKVMSRPQG